MNHFMLRDIQKANEVDMNQKLKFKEKYHLFENPPKHRICVDLKIIKFCI